MDETGVVGVARPVVRFQILERPRRPRTKLVAQAATRKKDVVSLSEAARRLFLARLLARNAASPELK